MRAGIFDSCESSEMQDISDESRKAYFLRIDKFAKQILREEEMKFPLNRQIALAIWREQESYLFCESQNCQSNFGEQKNFVFLRNINYKGVDKCFGLMYKIWCKCTL